MSHLVTQIAPHADSSDFIAGDIIILVVAIVGVMFIGIVAAIQAGETRFAKLLPCIKPPARAADDDYVEVEPTPKSVNAAESQKTYEEHERQKEAAAVKSFFLADRGMKWYFVGGALFASNIGAQHFVGMSGDGARRGIAVSVNEWYAAILLLLLGWLFSPVYRRAGVYTTPEFLEYRFNAACRHYLSVLTVVMYVLTKTSATIYGGAVVLQSTLGWNLYLGGGACILLSALYSIAGGLRAVMYTDFFQMCVFLIGGIVVMFVSLHKVGGFQGIHDNLEAQGRLDFWELWKGTDDPDYPWTGMLIGQPIGSVWYWCMDQDLVQRVLSAKDTSHAKAGTVFAGFLKMLPPFLIVIPGVIASIFYDMKVPKRGTDAAYPVLLTNLMPHGVIGLMVASIVMAMMSSLGSVFAAGSSVVTNDIYLKFRPNATTAQLVWVGRLSIIAYAVLSFCWIPVLSSGEGMYKKIIEIQSYLTPPIGIVLILGVGWKRINGQGAFAALILGGIVGVVRLIFVISEGDSMKGTMNSFAESFFYMNFYHFSIVLWVFSMIVCIVVSLLTPPPTEDAKRYTIDWPSVFKLDATERANPMWVNTLVLVMAVLSIAVMLVLWIVFPW
jgi:solute:Na+ symporter, SSS family